MTSRGSLRVGVVGGGMMGAIHARAWTAAGHQVAAVLERDLDVARRLAQPTGAATFHLERDGETDAFLDHVDVVSVCTPPDAHAWLVTRAVASGRHVLLEKPSARTLAEHDVIANAVLDAPEQVQVMVGTTSRFYPESRAAKKRMRDRPDPVLGMRERVRLDHAGLPAWYLDPAVAGGGVLLTNGIHAIDRMAWLVDATSVQVTSCTVAPATRRETFAQIDLAFETPHGPVPAQLQFHWQAGCTGRSELEIARTHDVVFVDTWDHYRAEGRNPERLDPYPDGATFDQRTQVGIEAQIDVLAAAIHGTRPLEATLAEHRLAMAAIETAYDTCIVTGQAHDPKGARA